MENQSQGLREWVARQSYIRNKSICFGLINRLIYAPTGSSLTFANRFYSPVHREELNGLFALNDRELEMRMTKLPQYEQAVNGNMLVECCYSKDKEFVALRLKHYVQIDYEPVSAIRVLQGDAAKQAAKVFDL